MKCKKCVEEGKKSCLFLLNTVMGEPAHYDEEGQWKEDSYIKQFTCSNDHYVYIIHM